MSRKEMLSRTRAQFLPSLFLILFLFATQGIIAAFGVFVNHGFSNAMREGIFTLVKADIGLVALGMVLKWKYLLDILFKSTEIFSGSVAPGQQIFGSKMESCEGAQWELRAKNGEKFKIYSDRMGLMYPSCKLPADMCAGTVEFRCLKRSKYIVEIIRIEKG